MTHRHMHPRPTADALPRVQARSRLEATGDADASRTAIDQAAGLAWAHDMFGKDLVVASSMGDEVLVHLASEVIPEIDTLFIDTGYHFAETLGTRDAVAPMLRR